MLNKAIQPALSYESNTTYLPHGEIHLCLYNTKPITASDLLGLAWLVVYTHTVQMWHVRIPLAAI